MKPATANKCKTRLECCIWAKRRTIFKNKAQIWNLGRIYFKFPAVNRRPFKKSVIFPQITTENRTTFSSKIPFLMAKSLLKHTKETLLFSRSARLFSSKPQFCISHLFFRKRPPYYNPKTHPIKTLSLTLYKVQLPMEKLPIISKSCKMWGKFW